MVLEADPAGLGFLPMGCLDHKGYKMADPKDFYQHMILEVVSNKINHSTYYARNLQPIPTMTPRLYTRTFNPTARNAINQHWNMNVLYSKAKHARGRVERFSMIHIDSSNSTYSEAWSNAEEGQARPKFIAVPLPKPSEARYVWIDMSWPIRAILLPVAQNVYDDMQPHCVYVQLNFRRLKGKIATSGFYEDNNQGFSSWEGDKTYGLYWTSTAASMRVDIDMMYGTLLLPRERRVISNELECLQLHSWSTVPSDWRVTDLFLRFRKDWEERCINVDGLQLVDFLSRRDEVALQYKPRTPSKLAQILDTLVQFGLNFVPIVGPLLAFMGSEIINAIEDPARYDTEEKMRDKFGKDMTKPMLESILNFRKFISKKSFMAYSASGITGAAYPMSEVEVIYSNPDLGDTKIDDDDDDQPVDSSDPVTTVEVISLQDDPDQQPAEAPEAYDDEQFDLFAETECWNLMPMFSDDVEEFQHHPERFASEVPPDLPVLKNDVEDETAEAAAVPVTRKEPEAYEDVDADGSRIGGASAGV